MPRELTFRLKKKEFKAVPVKIDRKKLYGWTEILAFDEQGRQCKLISTDDTSSNLISQGGTAQAILSSEGKWVERADLKAILPDGSPPEMIPSSYTITIELKEKISEEEFLNYSITDFYQLNTSEQGIMDLIKDSIYKFEYTYLDSYETTPAFILISDNTTFLLLGYENNFEMLCLGDCKTIEDENDYIEIGEDIDFGMF